MFLSYILVRGLEYITELIYCILFQLLLINTILFEGYCLPASHLDLVDEWASLANRTVFSLGRCGQDR